MCTYDMIWWLCPVCAGPGMVTSPDGSWGVLMLDTTVRCQAPACEFRDKLANQLPFVCQRYIVACSNCEHMHNSSKIRSWSDLKFWIYYMVQTSRHIPDRFTKHGRSRITSFQEEEKCKIYSMQRKERYYSDRPMFGPENKVSAAARLWEGVVEWFKEKYPDLCCILFGFKR